VYSLTSGDDMNLAFVRLQGWCCAFAMMVAGSLVHTAYAQSTSPLFIQVKSVKLRGAPKHWAPGLAEVPFGVEVAEVSRDGDWLKVRSPQGAEGYLHVSAVTGRRVVFKGKTADIQLAAEPTDVVLAGKGFASQLETMFRAGEPGLNYEAVDQLEQRALDSGALEKFLREGKLRLETIERGARG
jgi:hypothetical protein